MPWMDGEDGWMAKTTDGKDSGSQMDGKEKMNGEHDSEDRRSHWPTAGTTDGKDDGEDGGQDNRWRRWLDGENGKLVCVLAMTEMN